MTLVGFKGRNHPQQVGAKGPNRVVDNRATPPEIFESWSKRFGGFTIDVAASAENTKCERFYDLTTDGLTQSWAGERVWCNPPFSDIRPWVEKAWIESFYLPTRVTPRAELVVMLLPANRTEQGWWQHHIEPYRDRPGSGLTVEFLPGRMRFIRSNGARVGANERPPFGCCLVIWQNDGSMPTHVVSSNRQGRLGYE